MNLENEKELYAVLGTLTKQKSDWQKAIPQVASLIEHPSKKIQAKALWLIGEMGLSYPHFIAPYVELIAQKLKDSDEKIRERAVGALGRIGRAKIDVIAKYITAMLAMADDRSPQVRMNVIWAAENVTTENPSVFENSMDIFNQLLHDSATRVRREAPEIFRVIGKRKPEMVKPYIDTLKYLSENDVDRVVRIHSLGAIKAILNNSILEYKR
ncbi:MAG: HEAT repeat domain-containing protein [Peptococcaceae bacterium]|jgi:HEAT repeat protein|nr:HEAT repeat domain-containing protein [Peptococcaceae bacterium]